MTANLEEILDAAMRLPEEARLLVATRLLDTLPDDLPGISEDDPAFLNELERRMRDGQPTVPVSELWNEE